jgi:hypothetical protein
MVSVLVPARNEARNLARCLDAPLVQTHGHYEVIVLDDQSSDGTWRIARRYAEANPGRVRAVAGAPLPGDGWLGKPHAMQQLARKARGEYLLFTDADTIHGPDSIAWAVTNPEAHRKGGDVIPFAPRFLPFTCVFGMVLALMRLVGWTCFGLRVRGRENLHGVKRAILVSNHTLLLDPGVIAQAIRPRRAYFTMLEETALIPWQGTFVRPLGGVPIPERPDVMRVMEAACSTGLDRLGLVHLFPEGECRRWRRAGERASHRARAIALAIPLSERKRTTIL